MAMDGKDHACGECPVREALERRAFLRDVLGRGVATLGALAAFSSRAAAMSVDFASGNGGLLETAYQLPSADGVVIDRAESVIIARFDRKVYAFSLACPHQRTALRWVPDTTMFLCPKHRSKYRPDGTYIQGRATRAMDRFAIRRDGQKLMVNLKSRFRSDMEPAAWNAAFVQL